MTTKRENKEPTFFEHDGWTADSHGVFNEDGDRITGPLRPLSKVTLAMFKGGFDMGYNRGKKTGADLKSLEICRALNVQRIPEA